ncbi:MAG: serine hydrolase domain-containing protein [Dehalococcoidia bacterium]
MTTVSATSTLLPAADPAALGLDPERLERLLALIERHVSDGRYPGAQVAVARHGRLAALRTFGRARVAPKPVPAGDDTLWLLFSQTKVLTAATVWTLVEQGMVRFADRSATTCRSSPATVRVTLPCLRC